jgi:hypothetical protein
MCAAALVSLLWNTVIRLDSAVLTQDTPVEDSTLAASTAKLNAANLAALMEEEEENRADIQRWDRAGFYSALRTRSTHSVPITPAAQAIAAQCQPVVAALQAASHEERAS